MGIRRTRIWGGKSRWTNANLITGFDCTTFFWRRRRLACFLFRRM
jgi:hypothetical protein